MKNLKGMKSFSSLENKKIITNDATSVLGGSDYSQVTSNFLNSYGCNDTDVYVGGKFVRRVWQKCECYFDAQ